MSREENADAKFVRGLFSTVSWFMTILPVLFEIWRHDWLNLVLMLCVSVGIEVSLAIKKTPTN